MIVGHLSAYPELSGINALLVKSYMPKFKVHHLWVSTKPSQGLVILAANLIRLMEQHATLTSQAKVGARAKVNQKTIGRILHKTNEPTLEAVSAIAKAFGLECWQLLTPDLQPNNPPMLASQDKALKALYANLGRTQEAIAGVLSKDGNSEEMSS